jgi:ABC-2 type transport system ATP-binding protein
MPGKRIIEIDHLTKFYKGSEKPAIDHISLVVAENEIFGLLGPNGAGKTTTISILCGYLTPTSGNVIIDGLNLNTHKNEIKKIIGVVPQELALYSTLTAYENLRFFGHFYGLKGSILKKRIFECLEIFGLENNANKKILTFSGGMKRRVNLIAGMLHYPRVLFLDEPTVGIDVQSRNVILGHITELNKLGTTLIYTSHHMEEAEKLCSKVAIIDHGKLVIQGAPFDLLKQYPECTDLESIFLKLTGEDLRD